MNRSFTRQELYDFVWSEPMRTLAPQLGVSGVALAKTCRNHDIPIPPRGYWAKRQSGKKVRQPPLPGRGLGRSEMVRIGGQHSWYYYDTPKNLIDMKIPPPPVFPETVEDLTARIRKLVGKVPIPRDLTKAHRGIVRLLEADTARRHKYLAASYRSYWDAPLFDSPFEKRRLRLLNGIFIALERCTMRPSIRGNDPAEFDVRIGDERVTFKLDHPKQQQRWGHRSEAELSRPASEKLLLRISPNRKLEGLQLVWEDSADKRVEDSIEDVVVMLILAGEVQYRQGEQRHHEWLVERKAQLIEDARKQKEEEERQERERRIKAEKIRVERLLGEAAAFRQANDIRAYVALVRETTHASPKAVTEDELEAWAAWALAQADRIDPVRSRTFLARNSDESPRRG